MNTSSFPVSASTAVRSAHAFTFRFSLQVALLVVLAAAAVAEGPSRSKKETGHTAYGANADANRYLGTVGYSYYSQQQPYFQPAYPYNQPHNHLQQLPYQLYIDHHNSLNYPYNIDQYYQPHGQQPYDGQHYPYAGYQNDHQNGYLPSHNGAQQNGFGGYSNLMSYNQFGFRQAPTYPSPGFQPVHPPAPHPFYHTQGTYYPSQTTEANKPDTTIDPRKIYK